MAKQSRFFFLIERLLRSLRSLAMTTMFLEMSATHYFSERICEVTYAMNMKLLLLVIISTVVCAQQSTVMIIAHHGASSSAPENTLAAFRKAIEQGADAVVVDVRQTKDEHLVALHDATIDRTTNGEGYISDYKLKQIQKLDAGSWFNDAFSNEHIPTFDEVCAVLSPSTKIIIEIRDGSSVYPNIEQHVLDAIKKNNIEQRACIKSFDIAILKKCRQLYSKIPLIYSYTFHIPLLNIIVDKGVSLGSVFDIDAEYLQPYKLLLTASFVSKAQKRNYRIIAWGVETKESVREALELGVDAIETESPLMVKKMIAK